MRPAEVGRADLYIRVQGAIALSDQSAARNHGEQVTRVVATSDETFLHLLEAEAHLFMGEAQRAISEAHNSLEFRAPLYFDPPRARWVTAIYAWSGAEDDAVDMLDELGTKAPGVGPASVAHNLSYSIPLAYNARFGDLMSRLDSEMRRNAQRIETELLADSSVDHVPPKSRE